MDVNDIDLLREYIDRNSESAFAGIVERHVNFVYSVALRFTGHSEDAQDVTQAVFIILARKAARLRPKTILTGWLYETTRFTAMNFLTRKTRRQFREQEAYMQSTVDEANHNSIWQQLAPLLEEAMARLSERERTLLALRYFENRTSTEAASMLGIEEWAARKRGQRALEKLRRFFGKRGVAFSATAIAGAISANSVQAAPIGLTKTISAVAAAKGAAVGSSTITLVKGGLKLMAWAKAKTVIVVSGVVLFLAGTTIVTVTEVQKHVGNYESWQIFDPTQAVAILERTPPQVKIVPTRFPHGRYIWSDGRRTWSWVHYNGQKALGMNCDLSDIMRFACSSSSDIISSQRTKAVSPLPDQCYDFIANISGDAKSRLRQEIKEQLGVVGKFEERSVAALALIAATNNAEMVAGKVLQGTVAAGEGKSQLKATTTSDLAKQLELWMDSPVVDQTGISNSFDLTFRWQDTGSNLGSELKKTLFAKLGLQLVATNMPINMLVVERVKK